MSKQRNSAATFAGANPRTASLNPKLPNEKNMAKTLRTTLEGPNIKSLSCNLAREVEQKRLASGHSLAAAWICGCRLGAAEFRRYGLTARGQSES